MKGYRSAKKARYEERRKLVGRIDRVATTQTLPHFSFFEALFAKEKVETNVMADQRVDTNFKFKIASYLEVIKKHSTSLQVENLSLSLTYRNVT